MRKIGILGGTFNPPHIGHLIIANEVLHALKLEEIWFMPNQDPPHKQKEGNASNGERLEMLKLLIEGHPKFYIEPLEMERGGPSYTYETMKILKEKYRDYDFHFIIGGDMIEYLPNWHRIDELMKLVTFVGVNRPDFVTDTEYDVFLIDTPMIDLSSTLIRKRVAEGGTIRYLVPDSVREFIEENGLYGT